MALKVLVEKLNTQGVDRSQLTNKQLSCASFNGICKEFDKVITSVCVRACVCVYVCVHACVCVCVCVCARARMHMCVC